MGAGTRRAVARPRLGVDPFTTRNRPHWLLQMQEERRAARQIQAYLEESRGGAYLVKRSYAKADDGVGYVRTEIEGIGSEGLF